MVSGHAVDENVCDIVLIVLIFEHRICPVRSIMNYNFTKAKERSQIFFWMIKTTTLIIYYHYYRTIIKSILNTTDRRRNNIHGRHI